MAETKTTAENTITDAKTTVHTNTEILDIIAKMQREELERLGEILAVMQKFEQVSPKEQGDLQGAKSPETQNPKPEQPHNLVLKFAAKQHENKISRNLETIKNRKNKISQHENKIKSCQNKLERMQNKIARLREKIKQFKFSNKYLDSLKGEKFDGTLNFITAQNGIAIAKIQSQIEKNERRVLSGQNIIDGRKMKINILQEKISAAESKNELLRDKLQKISAFDALPNAALSYFIADKLGADIPHANKIIAAPEKVFTAEKMSEIAEKSGENVSAEIPLNDPQPKYSDKDFDKLYAALEYNSDEVRTLARFGGATEQLQLYAQFEGINPDLAEVVPLYLEEGYLKPEHKFEDIVMYDEDYGEYIYDARTQEDDYLVYRLEREDEEQSEQQITSSVIDDLKKMKEEALSSPDKKAERIDYYTGEPYTMSIFEIEKRLAERVEYGQKILDADTSKGITIYDDTAYFKVINKEDLGKLADINFMQKPLKGSFDKVIVKISCGDKSKLEEVLAKPANAAAKPEKADKPTATKPANAAAKSEKADKPTATKPVKATVASAR